MKLFRKVTDKIKQHLRSLYKRLLHVKPKQSEVQDYPEEQPKSFKEPQEQVWSWNGEFAISKHAYERWNQRKSTVHKIRIRQLLSYVTFSSEVDISYSLKRHLRSTNKADDMKIAIYWSGWIFILKMQGNGKLRVLTCYPWADKY